MTDELLSRRVRTDANTFSAILCDDLHQDQHKTYGKF